MSSLTETEKKKIMDLYSKLKEKKLSPREAKEYQKLVESKKEQAFNTGDFAIATGLLLLGAALVMYLAEKD